MIRKVVLDDVTAIHEPLWFYNKKGVLPARPQSKSCDHLRDFREFEDPEQKKIIGRPFYRKWAGRRAPTAWAV